MKIATKKYVDNQIAWLEKLQNAKVEAMGKAVEVYSASNNEWKEGHNQLSKQMKEQAGTFVTRRDLIATSLAIIGIVTTILFFLLNYFK